ncbi:oxidative stress-induced growth inhibitor 2-like [Thrips palmi]|uniref:Oxidative stress-induced growth inhibitor 2-like n=1 Tax=Thrips palmi TaxID=161013 RepID=A0A6P8ZGH2_THRPL|nr:oxidative stress-induced growth inhibitor 2-like [Thrips palmi]XP_034230099.1 oxidative stress-induced growth inhibitor 2-like [Thrips palmi]
MRDTANKVLPDSAVYKDVVIVGNGPSGIAVSHVLAGHRPYLRSAQHPDEMLSARLAGLLRGEAMVPLMQQDLRHLSQGLEGRAPHPLSLLMDALTHPGADQGLELPSLLQWRLHPEKRVDHVVLGTSPPGGAWQTMIGNVLTISLASWMELPGVDFRTWESSAGTLHALHSNTNERFSSCLNNNGSKEGRARAASVAQYYADYVRLRGLQKFFHCGTKVFNIEPLENAVCQCTETVANEWCGRRQCFARALWLVEGFDQVSGQAFTYVSQKVVIATGCTSKPNRLNVPGELTKSNHIVHDSGSVEELVRRIREEADRDQTGVDPILIVGAGLSAADAVLAARFHSVPVLHVFRSRTIPVDRQLPEIMYPEYHKVHQMMEDGGKCYPLYEALPEHRILSLTGLNSPDRKILMEGPDGRHCAHKVSGVAILIGARPNLSFLKSICSSDGTGLGANANAPIDCRSNPILIDLWSHKVMRVEQPGLYALGPLTGDNFVRFIHGGALAVASGILNEKQC